MLEYERLSSIGTESSPTISDNARNELFGENPVISGDSSDTGAYINSTNSN